MSITVYVVAGGVDSSARPYVNPNRARLGKDWKQIEKFLIKWRALRQ